MSVDIALDKTTGDLIVSPANDAGLVSGQDEVEQRMRIRLKVVLGTWQLQPSLGSTMNSLLRMPTSMTISNLPLVVKEALAPMSDVQVSDVTAWLDPLDPRKVRFDVYYQVVDSESEGQLVTFSDSITVVSG